VSEVAAFVRGTLPPPPARVLEVGAGAGELAALLADAGYDVVAIDPSSGGEHVRAVSLHELDEPAGSFDAAVAVLSLHHVHPLGSSCRRLGALVRRGGVLAIDEFDVARFDRRAAAWWLAQRGADEGTPEALVDGVRTHLHGVRTLRVALDPWFALGEPVRGPYLYRWKLGPELRAGEEAAIAAGEIPATGARLVGLRR